MLSKEAQFAARAILGPCGEEGFEEVRRLAKARTPASDRLLIELLEHRSISLRDWVLDALWEFGNLETARKAARVGIQAKSWFVRDTAAEMLEQVGTKHDVPALIHVLQSDKYWVARASAASSLGEHRTRAAISALEHAVAKDRYWAVRAYAVNALCRYGEKRFMPLIEQRIKREPEPAVLPTLYDAMIMMGSPAYVEKVIDLLYDPDYWYMVYLRTCVTLRGMFIEEGKPLPDRAIKGLRRVMKYDVAKAAKWSARDLLREVGIVVRGPKP